MNECNTHVFYTVLRDCKSREWRRGREVIDHGSSGPGPEPRPGALCYRDRTAPVTSRLVTPLHIITARLPELLFLQNMTPRPSARAIVRNASPASRARAYEPRNHRLSSARAYRTPIHLFPPHADVNIARARRLVAAPASPTRVRRRRDRRRRLGGARIAVVPRRRADIHHPSRRDRRLGPRDRARALVGRTNDDDAAPPARRVVARRRASPSSVGRSVGRSVDGRTSVSPHMGQNRVFHHITRPILTRRYITRTIDDDRR